MSESGWFWGTGKLGGRISVVDGWGWCWCTPVATVVVVVGQVVLFRYAKVGHMNWERRRGLIMNGERSEE